MRNSLPLSLFIHRRIRPFVWVFTIVLAVGAGVCSAVLTLNSNIKSNQKVLESLSPLLAWLVESSDRTEVQKAVMAVSQVNNSQALVIQDETVLASSRSPSELDLPYEKALTPYHFFGADLSTESIFTKAKLQRIGGSEVNAQIVMISPIWPVFKSAAFTGTGVLLFIIFVEQVFFFFLGRTVKEAVSPVVELDNAIRSLQKFSAQDAAIETGVEEINRIKRAVIETGAALNDAKDRLADARAKELLTEAYKILIHDLHTPISALRQKAKIIEEARFSKEIKEQSMKRMVELAEQILLQIESAKKNLELEASFLKEADICQSVSNATEQASHSIPPGREVKITRQIPSAAVLIPHDANLIQRAVANLLTNAFSACKKQVEVEVEQKQTMVCIRVSDDGPGMRPEEVGLHLQGRGVSANANRQSFGLASINHIVRSHGGKVVFSRSHLGGACFELRI